MKNRKVKGFPGHTLAFVLLAIMGCGSGPSQSSDINALMDLNQTDDIIISDSDISNLDVSRKDEFELSDSSFLDVDVPETVDSVDVNSTDTGLDASYDLDIQTEVADSETSDSSQILCRPCRTDDNCNSDNFPGSLCMDHGSSGRFCGIACGSGTHCPDGYECAVDPDSQNGMKQCQRSIGTECPCTPYFIQNDFKTTCFNESPWGKCEGERACDEICSARNPVEEFCNNVDDNCDGRTDEDLGNTTCGRGICLHTVANCLDGKPQACDPKLGAVFETCSDLDDDCDGLTDEYLGETTCGLGICINTVTNCIKGVSQVCDPLRGSSTEVCDGKDNDCDGSVDEGVKTTFYRDSDGDGYGLNSSTVSACILPVGYSAVGRDCDDNDFTRNPGKSEICDGKDNDCDGSTDEGFTFVDWNGSSKALGAVCGTGACANGHVTCTVNTLAAMCDSASRSSVEKLNGIDDDCDGQIDEGLCVPNCVGKVCGNDGCGGSCGSCSGGKTCNSSGKCILNPPGSELCRYACIDDTSCSAGSRCIEYAMPMTGYRGCMIKCSSSSDCQTAPGWLTTCTAGQCNLTCINDASCSIYGTGYRCKDLVTPTTYRACAQLCSEPSDCQGISAGYQATCVGGVCGQACINDASCNNPSLECKDYTVPSTYRACILPCSNSSDCQALEGYQAICE